MWAIVRATGLLLSRARRHRGLLGIFQFWLFAWTNALVKYERLSEADFDIESVPLDFDRALILPAQYVEAAAEEIPRAKIHAQQRLTVQQLRRLAAGPIMVQHPAKDRRGQ